MGLIIEEFDYKNDSLTSVYNHIKKKYRYQDYRIIDSEKLRLNTIRYRFIQTVKKLLLKIRNSYTFDCYQLLSSNLSEIDAFEKYLIEKRIIIKGSTERISICMYMLLKILHCRDATLLFSNTDFHMNELEENKPSDYGSIIKGLAEHSSIKEYTLYYACGSNDFNNTETITKYNDYDFIYNKETNKYKKINYRELSLKYSKFKLITLNDIERKFLKFYVTFKYF